MKKLLDSQTCGPRREKMVRERVRRKKKRFITEKKVRPGHSGLAQSKKEESVLC